MRLHNHKKNATRVGGPGKATHKKTRPGWVGCSQRGKKVVRRKPQAQAQHVWAVSCTGYSCWCIGLHYMLFRDVAPGSVLLQHPGQESASASSARCWRHRLAGSTLAGSTLDPPVCRTFACIDSARTFAWYPKANERAAVVHRMTSEASPLCDQLGASSALQASFFFTTQAD